MKIEDLDLKIDCLNKRKRYSCEAKRCVSITLCEKKGNSILCQKTLIPTNEGWLHLATVIDLCSRKIVGWSMSDNMKTTLVNDALTMALINRNPQKGLIRHTDRGSQYESPVEFEKKMLQLETAT